MRKLTHQSIYQLPTGIFSVLGLGTQWGAGQMWSCPHGSYHLVLAEFQSSLPLAFILLLTSCVGTRSFVSNPAEFFSLPLKEPGDRGGAQGWEEPAARAVNT